MPCPVLVLHSRRSPRAHPPRPKSEMRETKPYVERAAGDQMRWTTLGEYASLKEEYSRSINNTSRIAYKAVLE